MDARYLGEKHRISGFICPSQRTEYEVYERAFSVIGKDHSNQAWCCFRSSTMIQHMILIGRSSILDNVPSSNTNEFDYFGPMGPLLEPCIDRHIEPTWQSHTPRNQAPTSFVQIMIRLYMKFLFPVDLWLQGAFFGFHSLWFPVWKVRDRTLDKYTPNPTKVLA